jgi:hypothetical protein
MQCSITDITELSPGKLKIPSITCAIEEADDICSCTSKLQKDWLDKPWRNLQEKALHLSPQQSGIMCAKNLQGLGQDSTRTMPTLKDNSTRMTTQTREVSDRQPATTPITRTQCSVKKTAAELKGIDEIRQLNKKKIDVKRKKEEEESKCKKDEEEALKKAEEEMAKAIEEDNVAKNLHSIMNGIDGDKDIMEIDGNKDDEEDEQSPTKKARQFKQNIHKTCLQQDKQGCIPSRKPTPN